MEGKVDEEFTMNDLKDREIVSRNSDDFKAFKTRINPRSSSGSYLTENHKAAYKGAIIFLGALVLGSMAASWWNFDEELEDFVSGYLSGAAIPPESILEGEALVYGADSLMEHGASYVSEASYAAPEAANYLL